MHEAETPITEDPSREIFMAIITEIQELDDDPMARVDLVDYNSSDFDEFMSDIETTPIPTDETNLPLPPPSTTIAIQLEHDASELRKIRN